jgi:hypothetical protein
MSEQITPTRRMRQRRPAFGDLYPCAAQLLAGSARLLPRILKGVIHPSRF